MRPHGYVLFSNPLGRPEYGGSRVPSGIPNYGEAGMFMVGSYLAFDI